MLPDASLVPATNPRSGRAAAGAALGVLAGNLLVGLALLPLRDAAILHAEIGELDEGTVATFTDEERAKLLTLRRALAAGVVARAGLAAAGAYKGAPEGAKTRAAVGAAIGGGLTMGVGLWAYSRHYLRYGLPGYGGAALGAYVGS